MQTYMGSWQKSLKFIENKRYYSCLHMAVSDRDHVEIEELLRKGAYTEAQDSNGWTPLHLAVELGDVAAVKLLLKYGANPQARCQKKLLPLMFAVRAGSCPIVRLLLRHGCDVNELVHGTRTSYTYLHSAVYLENYEMVKTLLSCNADVNKPDSDGVTALCMAAEIGNRKIARLLLRHGARVHERNNRQRTALIEAITFGREDVFHLLLEHSEHLDEVDEEGDSLLQLAIKTRRVRLVPALLRHGADVNARSERSGKTALHLAVERNDLYSLEWLCEVGKARLDAADRRGCTALHAAIAEPNSDDVLNFVLELAANEDERSYMERVLLPMAFELRAQVVQRLLHYGARVDARNARGETALDIALEHISRRTSFHGLVANVGIRKYVEPLLLAGADYTGLFQSAELSAYRRPIVLRLLAQYFVKREVAGLSVDSRVLELADQLELKEFRRSCVQELDRMKAKRLFGSVTLYDLLRSSTRRLIGILRRPEAGRLLETLKHKEEFPLYSYFLEWNYLLAVQREPLFDDALLGLQAVLGCRLPILVVEEVLNYLDHRDMKNLIEVRAKWIKN